MAENIAAKRHAQAVFQIALENNQLEKWRSDLSLIASAFSQEELIAILEDPKIGFEDKFSLVKRCLPDISDLALNLANLLVVRRRVRIASKLAEEYNRLVDAHEGRKHAEVTTAVPVDKSIEKKLTEQLSELTESKVALSTKVDPQIIGGFVARIEDQLIDGSLRSKLESLRHTLREGG
ncbi:MAG: ATP synthase F1 subunit delta [Dehalococcoidia bacterium]